MKYWIFTQRIVAASRKPRAPKDKWRGPTRVLLPEEQLKPHSERGFSVHAFCATSKIPYAVPLGSDEPLENAFRLAGIDLPIVVKTEKSSRTKPTAARTVARSYYAIENDPAQAEWRKAALKSLIDVLPPRATVDDGKQVYRVVTYRTRTGKVRRFAERING